MSHMNDDQTMHLLRIASSDLPRPLEDLCARLRSADGRAWLEAQVQRLASPEGLTPAALLDGTAGLPALRSLKRRAIRLAETSLNARDRMAALVTHDLAVASAVAHHAVLLSHRPRDEWDARLIELSAASPEPWCTLFRAAADAEARDEPDGDSDAFIAGTG